jgi:phenylacetate-CoA ligase
VIDRIRHALHARLRPARYAALPRLLANQALDAETLARQHDAAFRAIVEFAARHTRYYAETLAADCDIAALPILEKSSVRARLDDLLADTADRRRVKRGHTGGSTGTPLAFWYDEAKHEFMRAGMMRSYMLSGWRPGQTVLNFWGARQDTAAGGVFGNGLYDAIAAERTFAAHAFSEAQLVAWARQIQRRRPALLQGYASVLAALARAVSANRLVMPASLIGVYSTAEVLTDDARQAMQAAFGCRVFNQYGCREIPNIACECRHGKMHIFTDLVRVESHGDDHRLLITSLSNRLMPMIRYAVGDNGHLSDQRCACGLPFPLLHMDVCRDNDHIVSRDGRRIHPSYFNRLLYGQTRIREYQWLQTAVDRIELNLVAPDKPEPGFGQALQQHLQRDIDSQMTLRVHYLDAIARTVSGKHRFVIGLTHDTRPDTVPPTQT